MINPAKLAVQLKPFHDFMEAYRAGNTYLPDEAHLKIVAEHHWTNDGKITFQDMLKLDEIYKELISD